MRIVLDNLTKKFGRVRALDQVTVAIEPGQVVALLGPNAAGKTTLLRCLAGILAPDGGHILYDNDRFNRGRVDLRRKLLFLPEFPIIFPRLTLTRQIAMLLRLFSLEPNGLAATVTEHLYQLDLLACVDTPIGQLSRGQIYKTVLAALFAIDPELWLLDEPFASGIDPVAITYLKQQARSASQRGRTVLYSTQILDIAEKFSDRVALIFHGGLKVFDAVSNLKVIAGKEGSALEETFRLLREEQR